ncbi:hypothetical protein BDY19DRAFT_923930 [Irpex rosettiformis]|uniref:Uncharacterized protein n=1 Tax=Irpex rosettiformis TaxID=378272 RepID=A0ACB8UIF2_9APHY|nr:hypothetical protein BDY19DRAFT_923930 [Irpex rosettiformis]
MKIDLSLRVLCIYSLVIPAIVVHAAPILKGQPNGLPEASESDSLFARPQSGYPSLSKELEGLFRSGHLQVCRRRSIPRLKRRISAVSSI